MIVLALLDDDGEEGEPLRFDQHYIHVGRGPHNDLVLDEADSGASYEHAVIAVLPGRAQVNCDPTANPTYIDGAEVTLAPEEERQLKPGDIISFGKGRSLFRVRRIGTGDEPREEPQKIQVRLPPPKGEGAAPRKPRVAAPPPPVTSAAHGVHVSPLTFQVYQDGQWVRDEVLDQPIVRVGRMRSSHLLLDDESVSRTHAVIEVTGQEVLLIDLDSSSGTAVNGTRVKKAVLAAGDQIEFGKARVVVSWGRPSPRPVARPRPAPAETGFTPTSTQVLSPDELEVIDGPRLIVKRNGATQAEVVLTKPRTTIGRLAENDIQLDDGTVSSSHAIVVAEAGVFIVIDQRSTNGTCVNGQRCRGESLRDGDVIQIGRYELTFVEPRGAARPRAPKTEVLSNLAAVALLAKVRPPGAGK
jgi:pSer/pThr/pTyr-binding forkhead associated (FHA) protein